MTLNLSKEEIEFYEPLIISYLKYGSVDKVFGKLYQNPGVSYPHFHRILKQWGIIKSAGPQSRLTEAVYFLTYLAKNKLPLQAVYRTMPPSLQISAVTLHRILSYVKRGLTRRHATALVVSPEDQPEMALIGQDISIPRPEIGKPYGALSLPMTFSKRAESAKSSILRVIQQEVASGLTLNRLLPVDLVPNYPQTLLTIDIADVRVRVYQTFIPKNLIPELNSYKLTNLTFISLDELAGNISLESRFRAGVPEIARGFIETKRVGESETTPHYHSLLNQRLALLPTYPAQNSLCTMCRAVPIATW